MGFDENGDAPAKYELLNWQMDSNGILEAKVVGIYDSSLSSGKEFMMKYGTITWKGKTQEAGNYLLSNLCT